MTLLQEKVHRLESILSAYGRVAVAFSGGADSSLLLKKTLDVLGAENVLVLTARSCLNKQGDVDNVSGWPARHGYGSRMRHVFVELQPLEWDEFTGNPPDRCYVCKLRVYRLFSELIANHGIAQLIDGTNHDDLHSDRPGLKALRELGIGTPLAQAGLSKEEVRAVSREEGLDTWDRPSGSCLATRLPAGLRVTRERIALVGKLESCLESLGFAGCRARLDREKKDMVTIQLQEKDLAEAATPAKRSAIAEFFRDSGMKQVLMDLKGR